MYAEHVIGLRALELARAHDPQTAVAVRERFAHVCASGALAPRHRPKKTGDDGGVFDLDRLAGDGRFVFLSYGPRYRDEREPVLCYGFLFDPVALVTRHGALVGPDMLDEYEEILHRVAQQVDANLPPLPVIADDDVAAFMALMGEDDPALAAHIKQSSVSRYHDICRAVRDGDMSVEGAEEAMRLFQTAARQAQSRLRLGGQAALDALAPGMEILVPDCLPIASIVGTIEAGEVKLL